MFNWKKNEYFILYIRKFYGVKKFWEFEGRDWLLKEGPLCKVIKEPWDLSKNALQCDWYWGPCQTGFLKKKNSSGVRYQLSRSFLLYAYAFTYEKM